MQCNPNPFPFSPFPVGTNIDFSQFAPIGFGFNTEDPRFTAPRSTNFNLTIERQLDKATIVSLGYVGNRGRHEEGAVVLNLAGSVLASTRWRRHPGRQPHRATRLLSPGLLPCPNPASPKTPI